MNDVKINELQVEIIKSGEDNPVSGSNSIAVKDVLTYDQLYDLENDGDLVYKAYLETVIRTVEFITVPDSNPIVIDWQNDLVPSGTGSTWAEKFGNNPFRFQGWFGTTTLQNYIPNIQVVYSGAIISTVTFNDVFQGKIIVS